jgi:signal transduction histidine kinase
MDETPAEREQRLARIKEMSLVDRQLKRARTTELKRQSDEVQRLAQEQDWVDQARGAIEELDPRDGELPATASARRGLVDALRRYAGELGVEIRTHWVG